jgi:hypothetical protein
MGSRFETAQEKFAVDQWWKPRPIVNRNGKDYRERRLDSVLGRIIARAPPIPVLPGL